MDIVFLIVADVQVSMTMLRPEVLPFEIRHPHEKVTRILQKKENASSCSCKHRPVRIVDAIKASLAGLSSRACPARTVVEKSAVLDDMSPTISAYFLITLEVSLHHLVLGKSKLGEEAM